MRMVYVFKPTSRRFGIWMPMSLFWPLFGRSDRWSYARVRRDADGARQVARDLKRGHLS